MANRKSRRAAAAKAAKGTKVATIAAPLQTEVSFNKNGKHVKAMIAAGVAAETSVISNAVVAVFSEGWAACKAGEMSPDHAADVLKAIHVSVAAKRGEKASKNADGARVSDTKTALKIFDWKCVGNLIEVLNTIDTLTFEKLVAIVRWMKGTPQKAAQWKSTHLTAPSKAELIRVMNKTKKRATKSSKRGGFKKGKGVVGMPSDPVRGLAHVVKCAVAFNKKHAKDFASKSDAKLMAGVINTLNALFKPTRALQAARELAAAAKVAK
jgi:hypothetical protein